MRKRIAATAAAVVACVSLVACSSSSGSSPEDEARHSSQASEAVAAANAAVEGTLRGIGATLEGWVAAHTADTDPKLAPACCYGPTLTDVDGASSTDTWVVVQHDDSPVQRVYSFTHNFVRNTPSRVALAEVEAQDLPPDARRVKSSQCGEYLYASATLEREAEQPGGYVAVVLSSPPDGTDFDTARVMSADVMLSNETLDPC